MDEISKVLDKVFNDGTPEPEREKVTADELRVAYCKAEKLEGHWLVGIYELEDGRCIFVDRGTSNGETMTAWWKDSDEPEFKVKEILEPCSFDDDGEPLQYDLIGFEEA